MKNIVKTLATLTAAVMMLSSAAALAEDVETSEIPVVEEIVEVIETVEEAPAAEIVEVIETVEEPVRTAKIRLVCDDEVDYGATIKLVAELDGFESTEYGLQWQVNNGNGWKDIDGANASSYSFELSESNMDDTYRVLVTL